jgi:hypothetical protein
VETALAKGMDWAASASASYVGLQGAGNVAAAAEGASTDTYASQRELRRAFGNFTVKITTSTLGGVDGLPREEWLGSLQYPAQWRVIQRAAPVPVWKIIERLDPRLIGSTKDEASIIQELTGLAGQFEDVWVKDVFLASADADIRAEFDAAVGSHDGPVMTAQNLELFLWEKTRSFGRSVHLEWHRGNTTNNGFEDCTQPAARSGPSVCIFRNQLFLYYLEKHDTSHGGVASHATKLVGTMFDGVRWSRIPVPVEKDATRRIGEGDADDLAYVNWLSEAEPACLGREVPVAAEPHRFFRVIKCAISHSDKEKKNRLEFQVGHPAIYGGSTSRIDLRVHEAPVGIAGPALFDFEGQAFVLYTDVDRNIVLRKLGEDGTFPDQPSALCFPQGHRTEQRIAVAVLNGRVTVAYRDTGADGKLVCVTTPDLARWDAASTIAPSSQSGPALAVFSGPGGPRMYCAYAESGGDGALKITSTQDGVEWSAPVQILAALSGHTPALAAFRDQEHDRLYCFYRGAGNDTNIHYAVTTGPR